MSRTLGERIKSKRIHAGLSQADLAEKVQVSQATISNWEKDNSEPNDEELATIGSVIGKVYRKRETEESTNDNQTEEGASPFGVWANKTRLKKQLSVPELAARAGLSAPTVYAIESGRFSNPRSSTKAALEKALGESLSRELTEEVERDSSIAGFGELIDFNPHDQNEIPDEPGVYVLYDISERPIYVGQGKSIKSRLNDHEQKFWFKRPIVETAAYVRISKKEERESVESLLIKFLKSNAVLNKQKVDR